MFIGELTSRAKVEYFLKGTKKPLEQEKILENYGWKWQTVMDQGLDVVYTLEETAFIGMIHVEFGTNSAVSAIEIYCDGVLSGRYDAETGKQVRGAVEVSVGASANEVTVRLCADLKHIILNKLEIYGGIENEPLIYPTPANRTFGEGTVALSDISGFCELADEDLAFCAKHLTERISEYYPGALFAGEGKVKIALVKNEEMHEDAYRLSVKADGITVTAKGRRGLLYGCETLFQLLQDGQIPVCEVDDKPYKEMRGFHMGVPPKRSVEFFKNLVKYVLLPMRYNQIFIYFAGCMRFDRHPEIAEGWVQGVRDGMLGLQPKFPHCTCLGDGDLWEKDEIRALCDFMRSYGFELIPEVQSLSHVQYITYAHPELAEIDEELVDEQKDTRNEDQPPSVFYKHSYCPSNEKSYEIIFDIIDEIVEVVRPERYVHIGHDEVYQMGLCPLCKDKPHDRLLAYHINRLYDHIAKKGLGTMMWADMLQPTEKRYKTCNGIKWLPKDIILLDFVWYFHFDMDIEENLLPYGFTVAAGNLYSSHYPRYEKRMKDMIGGEVSLWCKIEEYTLAKKGKIFDLMYTAEMLWNPDYTHLARPVYNKILSAMQPVVRDEIRGIAIRKDQKAVYTPAELPESKGKLPCLLREALADYYDPNYDISRVNVLKEEATVVPVGKKHQRLVFLHATLEKERRVAWAALERIGKYVVRYADGETVELPIEYAGNIRVWNERFAVPMPQQYYRHQGYVATYMSDPVIERKTEDGKDASILGFQWVNPNPEKEIAAVECVGTGNVPIALFGISGMDVI